MEERHACMHARKAGAAPHPGAQPPADQLPRRGRSPGCGGAPGLHACMFKGRGSQTKTQAREKGRITLFRASICAVSPTATLVLFVPCAPPDGTMLRRGGTFRVSCPVVRERKDTCPDATFTLVRYQRPLGLRRARGWWWTRHRAKTNTQLRQQCDCQLSIPQTSEQTQAGWCPLLAAAGLRLVAPARADMRARAQARRNSNWPLPSKPKERNAKQTELKRPWQIN